MSNIQIDLLNREEDLKKIINVIETLSTNKENSNSYAIEGVWGSGKSWLINRLAAELYDMQDLDIAGGKYCVLKFNPWEYDYYNEPLLSLILSLKNQVKAETSIFNIRDDHIKMFKDSMKILAEELVDPVLDCISIATANPSISFWGKIFVKKTKQIKNELDKKSDEYKTQKRHLNPYIDLEEVMKKVTEGLNKISKDKTVILLVDELDRCIPNYAIKVLERMHHITANVKNIQIIYSIDRNQLDETIRKVYGQQVDVKNYLKKFFSISFKLEAGNLSNEFINQHKSLFDKFDFTFSDNVDISIAFSSILPDINMREREYILQKIELINSTLIKEDEILDFSVLYVELFLVYCIYNNFDIYNISAFYSEEDNSIYIADHNNDLSQYIEALYLSHSVRHETHGYEGYYNATFENVFYNLWKNLQKQELPSYLISWEQDFYRNSFAFLNNFIELYKDIEM